MGRSVLVNKDVDDTAVEAYNTARNIDKSDYSNK
jgi:hypothetical protein